ncbi:60S ribosomal protein [Populus alba x Populus x berolinensis]|nr:60S ribosomal protein [Populus alba x Populus x berolinensis]
MRLEKCWFCSSTVYPGHGIQFVRNDAKWLNWCFGRVSTAVSVVVHAPNWHVVWVDFVDPLVAGNPRSKCHKNFKMKRNPRKVKWTKAYRRLHGKDMTQDTTFEFERKRNRPERYDRNLAENTLKAIKKIDKVRSDRAASHIEKRSGKARSGERHKRNWSSRFTWSRLLKCFDKTNLSRYPRSKSRFLNQKARKIRQWKSDFVSQFFSLYFCFVLSVFLFFFFASYPVRRIAVVVLQHFCRCARLLSSLDTVATVITDHSTNKTNANKRQD